MDTDTTPDALADSIAVAARRLGLGRSQLYKELAKGTIAAKRLGRRVLIPRVEQARFLAALPDAHHAGQGNAQC